MNRGIGIAGTAGAGKTMLATAYSEESGFDLVSFDHELTFRMARTKIRAAKVIEEYGKILKLLELEYRQVDGRFITNLTPIDVMTEMYSSFAWHNVPSERHSLTVNFLWQDALRICRKYLTLLVYVQPPLGCAKQEHMNLLGAGLVHAMMVEDKKGPQVYSLRRNIVDNIVRTNTLKKFVFYKFVEDLPAESSSSSHH